MMKIAKIVGSLSLLGCMFAAEQAAQSIPLIVVNPSVGFGFRNTSQWAGNDKHRGSQLTYELSGDLAFRRDLKMNIALSGISGDRKLYPNRFPALLEADDFPRDGQTRDSVQDFKLGIGYNVLSLTTTNDHLLYLNAHWITRDIEKDWVYRHIDWGYELVSIGLEGESYIPQTQGFLGLIMGSGSSFLYGASYKFPIKSSGIHGFDGLRYKIRGYESEAYVGFSRHIDGNFDIFAKISVGISRYGEHIQYTPSTTTKSHYTTVQFGIRGNPFYYLK